MYIPNIIHTACSVVWNKEFTVTPKKFRQINSLVKRYFHEFFCQRSKYEVLHHSVVWKIQKFTLTKKIFRQINSLVIYLVKSLLSRNFCQKCVRENFRNFHSVVTVVIFCNFHTV